MCGRVGVCFQRTLVCRICNCHLPTQFSECCRPLAAARIQLVTSTRSHEVSCDFNGAPSGAPPRDRVYLHHGRSASLVRSRPECDVPSELQVALNFPFCHAARNSESGWGHSVGRDPPLPLSTFPVSIRAESYAVVSARTLVLRTVRSERFLSGVQYALQPCGSTRYKSLLCNQLANET